MKRDDLEKLRIAPSQRSARGVSAILIFVIVAIILAAAAWFAWPRSSDTKRLVSQTQPHQPDSATRSPAPAATPPPNESGVLLTTSGYIINRERIELSPRFVGIVRWIGVKKGDPVKKNQVVVLLDDSEQRSRLTEAEGRLARAQAALQIARTRYYRLRTLREQRVESEQQLDDAQAEVNTAEAGLREAEGLLNLARWNLEWTVIRSPIDGVVLEKLADENELVSPQSFGGDKGPSTALLAVADPQDLQVEIDLNEADLSKVWLGQSCRVTPEAYPDKAYEGYVAEIAPEANRQKGTLQIKVQVKSPDKYLIPELSARVDFLDAYPAASP
ncbi:MAG TPA: efflux RND transporter periplasmic adaptor subunit [Terrimicrobiaceae bacterium]|nr:efflux RND transporter periplasmic adaptor subunit [Terrimicrobiaceae bacterium]